MASNSTSYLKLVFLVLSILALINRVVFGLGYFLFFGIIMYGVIFKLFKFKYNAIPSLFTSLIFILIFLFIFNSPDITIYFRVFLLVISIFIAYSIRLTLCFNSESLARFFIIIGIISALIGIKQFFLGYSNIEYYFLSFNNSMQEELLGQNLRRGLGFYFDPLAQVTILGISIHSLFYLRSNFNINKFVYFFCYLILLLACLLTLSRAGILGLIISYIVYLNSKKIKYFYQLIAIFFICFSAIIILSLIFAEDFTHINNLVDSFASIDQIFNADIEVSARFGASGSYGSRMDGIKDVISNFFNSDELHRIGKLNSARDLGLFSLPILYGFPIFIFVLILFFFNFPIIINKYFKAKNYNHFSLSIFIFLIAQSFVTFQLDSTSNVFILVFFAVSQSDKLINQANLKSI